MSKVQELWNQFVELTPEEQEQFRSQLNDNGFPDPPGEDISPEEWEEVWGEEIARRIESLKRGETKARPWPEVYAELKKKLSKGKKT